MLFLGFRLNDWIKFEQPIIDYTYPNKAGVGIPYIIAYLVYSTLNSQVIPNKYPTMKEMI